MLICVRRLSDMNLEAAFIMTVLNIIIVGVFSCLVFDLFQRILKAMFGIPPSNWALVGRWLLGLLTSGQLMAQSLADQHPRQNEHVAGWCLHYAVAVLYAAFYWALMEAGIVNAGLRDGLIFGIASVCVPWFFFMPVMGNGIMGHKTANPPFACFMALVMHSVFGAALGVGFGAVAG